MTGNQAAELLRAVRQPPADAPDAELLARFAARRDEPAFRELVRRHGPVVFGVCRRVSGHAQDAEDAFQAVFLTLARKAQAIRRPELLGNYLYGVAVRVARRARRAAARRKAREVQVTAMPEVPTAAADAWSDLAPVLDAELAALPAWYQSAVLLCDVQGLARAEAASRLGVPEGTLSSRLNAGRRKLADRLAKRGITLPAAGLAVVVSANGTAAVPARLLDETVTATLGDAAPAGVIELAREGVWTMRAKLAGVAAVMGSAAVGWAVLAAPQAPPEKAGTPKQAEAKPTAPAEGEKALQVRPRVRKTIDFSGQASWVFWSDDGKKLAVVVTQLEGGVPSAAVQVFDPDNGPVHGVYLKLQPLAEPPGFLPGGIGFVTQTRETGLINAHNRLEFWPAAPVEVRTKPAAPEKETELSRRFSFTHPTRTCDLDDIAGYFYAFARDGKSFVNDFAETAPDGRVVRSGLRLIDVETGEATKTLVQVDGPLMRVAVSADLARAFTLSGDGAAQLWDLTTGKPVWTKTRPATAVVNPRFRNHNSFAQFSPDGQSIYVIDYPWDPRRDLDPFRGGRGVPEPEKDRPPLPPRPTRPSDRGRGVPEPEKDRPPGGLRVGLNRIDARSGELAPLWPGAETIDRLSGFSHDGRLLLTVCFVEKDERGPGSPSRPGQGGSSPSSADRSAALSVWNVGAGALAKRWHGSASAAFSPTKPVLAIFETSRSSWSRGPTESPPVYSSRLGFWDFAAPAK